MPDAPMLSRKRILCNRHDMPRVLAMRQQEWGLALVYGTCLPHRVLGLPVVPPHLTTPRTR